MALRHDFRSRPPEQVRVVVFGATGYIGRFVVRELVERGYQVVAFARERSGIGGRQIGGVVGSDRLRSGHLVRLWPNRAEQPTGGTKAHHSSGESQNGPQWMTTQPGHQPLRLGGRHRPQAGYGA